MKSPPEDLSDEQNDFTKDKCEEDLIIDVKDHAKEEDEKICSKLAVYAPR